MGWGMTGRVIPTSVPASIPTFVLTPFLQKGAALARGVENLALGRVGVDRRGLPVPVASGWSGRRVGGPLSEEGSNWKEEMRRGDEKRR